MRTVVAAQKAYAAVNGGYYDTLECLTAPSACLPAVRMSPFLDGALFVSKDEAGSKVYRPIPGHRSFFIAGPRAELGPNARVSRSSITGFGYVVLPQVADASNHGFLADDLGRICVQKGGFAPPHFLGRCASEELIVGLNDQLVSTGRSFPPIAKASEPSKPSCPQGPFSVAVNPVSNKVYVANGQGVIAVSGMKVAAVYNPTLVAVNPTTNRIYVLKPADGDANGGVVVINGATNAMTTIPGEVAGGEIAVDAGANRVYVSNTWHHSVTVIDGATNTTKTVPTVRVPSSMAVNPVTHKVYVLGVKPGALAVIDGAANQTATVPIGEYSKSVTVNQATNRIYVAGFLGGDVTVVDGATNAATTMPAWHAPESATVGREGDADCRCAVTIVDGATNKTSAVLAGSGPEAVAVNAVTNKIYVANGGSGDVTVIDGATNATQTVRVGSAPTALAVNPLTNRIYVANRGSNNVTVIDGATNRPTTIPVGSAPASIAVNPKTNKIYVVNGDGQGVTATGVTVIDGATNAATTLPLP